MMHGASPLDFPPRYQASYLIAIGRTSDSRPSFGLGSRLLSVGLMGGGGQLPPASRPVRWCRQAGSAPAGPRPLVGPASATICRSADLAWSSLVRSPRKIESTDCELQRCAVEGNEEVCRRTGPRWSSQRGSVAAPTRRASSCDVLGHPVHLAGELGVALWPRGREALVGHPVRQQRLGLPDSSSS